MYYGAVHFIVRGVHTNCTLLTTMVCCYNYSVEHVTTYLYMLLFAYLSSLVTDEIFIRYMHSYLLTEEQLVENGYPRSTGEPGVASIVRKPDDVNDIKPVGPNGTYNIRTYIWYSAKKR